MEAGQNGQVPVPTRQVEVEEEEGRHEEAEYREVGEGQNINCKLEVHKTVQWILEKWEQSESPSRFRKTVNGMLRIRSGKSSTALKGFTHDGDKWKLDGNAHCLEEAKLMRQELDMVKEWTEAADKTQSSLESLRNKRREAAEREGNPATRDPIADELSEDELLEDELSEESEDEEVITRPDDEIFRDVTDWDRWRGVVDNGAAMNKSASLIEYLGPLYERERESESENGLPCPSA